MPYHLKLKWHNINLIIDFCCGNKQSIHGIKGHAGTKAECEKCEKYFL